MVFLVGCGRGISGAVEAVRIRAASKGLTIVATAVEVFADAMEPVDMALDDTESGLKAY